MSLNASECCRTIGCNCAGTQLAETMNSIPHWAFPVVIGVGALIVFIILWKFMNRVDAKLYEKMMEEAGK